MRASFLAVGFFALKATCAPHQSEKSSNGERSWPKGQKEFSFPLSDGFPNIAAGSAALKDIEKLAHGTLPNGKLPTNISSVSAATWELIAFNELFEVAYFSNLIDNITHNEPGYEIGSRAATNIITNTLKAVRAQEQLHALGANGILQASGNSPIKPCKYIFPVDNFDDAIAFASTFTDVVLGTLQGALTNFLEGGDGADFLGLVGSVIGQEGEQNGIYRAISQPESPPSSQPFLTASSGSFALSALLQMVIVPGSCPVIPPVPTFQPLTVETLKVHHGTDSIEFSFGTSGKNYDSKAVSEELSLVYINGQNVPVVEKLKNVRVEKDTVHFTADFPFAEFQMDGLTISAVTSSAGPFANAGAVATATLFGPGLIEVV